MKRNCEKDDLSEIKKTGMKKPDGICKLFSLI